MAIEFESVEYRNFLSTGNVPNKIYLNRSQTTLIIGKNGDGKSTLLDALTFALFGKPFRNINKGQLINSINGKQCLVVLEFSVDNKKYKVIRGIKPNIFEIWRNGEMINQDAAARDYQKVLEQQILNLNYKTFTQVIILGSASFIPFMQLSSVNRRDVIEDILDIRIFSVMNQILKNNISVTKDAIFSLDSDIKIAKTKVESQKAIIDIISKSETDKINKLNQSLRENESIIKENEHNNKLLFFTIQDNKNLIIDKDKLEDEIDSIKTDININESTLKQFNRDIKFFVDKTNCPTCKQDIDDIHKDEIINELKIKVDDISKKINELKTISEEKRILFIEYENIADLIYKQEMDYSNNNRTIKFIKQQNEKLLLEIDQIENNTTNVDEEKNKLKVLAQSTLDKINEKKIHIQDKGLQEVASVLLKDSGIKTAIIREYLPVMNKLINKYLNEMDSYIHFELDENFNEIIRSRYRDEFTYDSFSEGEKQRIDLALLFTWRHIAQMKNSVNTNLLILDETFDASMDSTGTELLMQVLDNLSKNVNVFVISHKGDQLLDKFDSTIKFEKRNDFSLICD